MWFDKLTTNGEHLISAHPELVEGPFVLSLSKDPTAGRTGF